MTDRFTRDEYVEAEHERIIAFGSLLIAQLRWKTYAPQEVIEEVAALLDEMVLFGLH